MGELQEKIVFACLLVVENERQRKKLKRGNSVIFVS
jgi:hypothetical protein